MISKNEYYIGSKKISRILVSACATIDKFSRP